MMRLEIAYRFLQKFNFLLNGRVLLNTKRRVRLLPYFFMLPAFILLLLLFVVPFICNVLISLTDWNGINLKFNFIGLQNYISMFRENSIFQVLMNNLKFLLILVLIQNFIALIVSLLLYEAPVGKVFFKAVVFIPTLLSMVAVSFMWTYMLDPINGVLYKLFDVLHLSGLSNIMWLGDERIIVYVLAIISMWQWTGWNVVIYLAGLTSIPKDLYESCEIDGASFLARLRHITIPMLAPAFSVNIIMSTIGALKIFDLPFIMTKGGPGHSSETIAITIYNNSFLINKMGYGAALSLVLFVLVLIVSIAQTTYFKRLEEDIT